VNEEEKSKNINIYMEIINKMALSTPQQQIKYQLQLSKQQQQQQEQKQHRHSCIDTLPSSVVLQLSPLLIPEDKQFSKNINKTQQSLSSHNIFDSINHNYKTSDNNKRKRRRRNIFSFLVRHQYLRHNNNKYNIVIEPKTQTLFNNKEDCQHHSPILNQSLSIPFSPIKNTQHHQYKNRVSNIIMSMLSSSSSNRRHSNNQRNNRTLPTTSQYGTSKFRNNKSFMFGNNHPHPRHGHQHQHENQHRHMDNSSSCPWMSPTIRMHDNDEGVETVETPKEEVGAYLSTSMMKKEYIPKHRRDPSCRFEEDDLCWLDGELFTSPTHHHKYHHLHQSDIYNHHPIRGDNTRSETSFTSRNNDEDRRDDSQEIDNDTSDRMISTAMVTTDRLPPPLKDTIMTTTMRTPTIASRSNKYYKEPPLLLPRRSLSRFRRVVDDNVIQKDNKENNETLFYPPKIIRTHRDKSSLLKSATAAIAATTISTSTSTSIATVTPTTTMIFHDDDIVVDPVEEFRFRDNNNEDIPTHVHIDTNQHHQHHQFRHQHNPHQQNSIIRRSIHQPSSSSNQRHHHHHHHNHHQTSSTSSQRIARQIGTTHEYVGPSSFNIHRLSLPSIYLPLLRQIIDGCEKYTATLSKGWRTDLYSLTKNDLALRKVDHLYQIARPIVSYLKKVVSVVYGCRGGVKMDKNQPHVLKYSTAENMHDDRYQNGSANGATITNDEEKKRKNIDKNEIDGNHTGVELHHDKCDYTVNLMLSSGSSYIGGG